MEANRFLKSINTSYLLYIRGVIKREFKENTIGFTLKNNFHNELTKTHIIRENKNIPATVFSGEKLMNVAFICPKTSKIKSAVKINLFTDNFLNTREEFLDNLISESRTIKEENDDLSLISINIFPSNGSYYDKYGRLKDIGIIEPNYLEIFKHYENENYYNKIINYIVNVDEPPNNIKSFHEDTPYVPVKELIKEFEFC